MTTRKKFYFLVNSLEWGGAERVIVNLSRELARGHDVSIITLKPSGFYELPSNVRHIVLSGVRNNILMFVAILWYVWRLRRLFAREGFDNGVSFLEIANFVHILAKREAIISSRIHLDFFVGTVGRAYRVLIGLLYPMAGQIITNSEENRIDLSHRLGIPTNKVTTIYNPIDLESVQEKMNESIPYDLGAIASGRRTYITVGRLVWQKHHEKIIRAFARVRDSGISDFVYFIVGDGPERPKLESIVRDLGLEDQIRFFGEQRNVFPFLKASNCFVYASEVEGFPNVLIEAMACGLPIITSDFVSGAKECILGEYPKNSWKTLKYPYFGPNGALLEMGEFEDQFVTTFSHIQTAVQEQKGMERFTMENAVKNFQSLL